MIRKILTYLVQAIGVLGIIVYFPLRFIGGWISAFQSTGATNRASYSKSEAAFQVVSYFLFFVILIVAGWYFRRKK